MSRPMSRYLSRYLFRSARTRPRRRAPLIAAAVAGTVLAAWTAAAAFPASVSASTVSSTPALAGVAGAQQQVLALVNSRRQRHGCGPLTASVPLTQLAQSYSTEMGTEDFFSHTDPAGRTPWDRAKAVGIANFGGENIAMGQQSPQSVMSAWMSSPGHRANILDCSYRTVGVGVYYGYDTGSGPWWTEDFGF